MDQDRPNDLVTISFSQPVSAFGAYWGSGIDCLFGDAASILTFQDVNGNVIGSDSFFYEGNGTLEWHGYAFATPVKTITRTASDGKEGFAMDGLQATVASSGGNSALLSNISARLCPDGRQRHDRGTYHYRQRAEKGNRARHWAQLGQSWHY